MRGGPALGRPKNNKQCLTPSGGTAPAVPPPGKHSGWPSASTTLPGVARPIEDVDLVPVLVDISTAEDVHLRIGRLPASQRLLRKAIRLCEQAHKQGGLLSNCDLAELLGTCDSRIAHLLAEHERQQHRCSTTRHAPRRRNRINS